MSGFPGLRNYLRGGFSTPKTENNQNFPLGGLGSFSLEGLEGLGGLGGLGGSKSGMPSLIDLFTEDSGKKKNPTFAGTYKEWLGGMDLPKYMDKAEKIAEKGAWTKFGLNTTANSLNNMAAGMQATGQNLLNASTNTGANIMKLASKQQPSMNTAFTSRPLSGSYLDLLQLIG